MKFYIDVHLFGAQTLKAHSENTIKTEQNRCFKSGYSMTLQDGHFTHLFLNFSEGFHAYKVFDGGVFYREHTFYFDENTRVNDIQSIFGKPVDGYKDALEISRTFIVSGLEITFSWYHDDDGVVLTYMLAKLSDGFYGADY